jgi:hypothetical protein
LSKSGQGGDGGPDKPAPSSDDGMAVIRRQRRSSLEKALRGGSNPEAEKPNAAAAWGGMLQRGVRSEQTRNEPAKPEPARPEPARPEPARPEPAKPAPPPVSDPPKAERPAPATGSMPRVPASTGSMPRVPASTGSMPRIPGNSTPKTSSPLPNVGGLRRPPEADAVLKAARAPSMAAPEDVEDPDAPDLSRQADQLASAHEVRERNQRFRMHSLGLMLRIVGALLLVSVCGFLSVSPSLEVVRRAERVRALTQVVSDATTSLEADPRLAGALAAQDLPTLRDIFTKQRAGAVSALQAAGFPEANDGTLRVRLADAGKSIALSAEFPEDDGEVTAATRKTGQHLPLPEVPGLMDVVLGEYLLNAAALGFTALAGLLALFVWPWLRARRDA